MQDKSQRRPAPAAELAFTPVPRAKPRHDGWTPERQRAFVHALADTGCVKIAARMVNMTSESAYQLRRQPGAETFRKAWEAAQGLGLQVVKDEAFDRALNGQLVPVFVAGKLMGFRRKKNDRLLMFILRHYGFAPGGGRTTVNYVSTRATAGAARLSAPGSPGEGDHARPGEGVSSAAEASTTTVRTVISGKGAGPRPAEGEAARRLETFAGFDLDDRAKADIYRALEAAAERRRALDANPADDPDIWYVGEQEAGAWAGELEPGIEEDRVTYRPDGEHGWHSLGEGGNAAEIDEAVAAIKAARASAAPALGVVEGPVPSLSRAQSRGEIEGPVLSDVEGPVLSDVEGPPLEAPATPAADSGMGEARRPYRKRQPKPPFTLPDEDRKAQALETVAAERRAAAAAEGRRRRLRKAAARRA